ncbi:MAG: hypothetical protein M0Q38_03280 [Bacteroidales bacterium]|jgi:hypothetical protein|nr:hypothetical protein [Bacteroidales bacterium]
MKQKIFVIAALILLLCLILFMTRDLFFSHSENKPNPYEYDLKALKSADTTQSLYTEDRQIHTRLAEIHGVATDAADNIYIAGNGGVEIYSRDGVFLKKFSIKGTARCITVDVKDNIYLGMEDHVEIWNGSGKLITQWTSPGEESIITSIAVTDTWVFLADAGRKVVYRCDLSGKMIDRIGEKDPENKIPGFIVPSPYFDLGIAPDGSLWVVNPGRHEFEKYTFDGRLVSTWGEANMTMEGFCGCCNPSHFAFLHDGSFVTSEKGIERIKIYTSGGKFNSIVALSASFEEGTKGLDLAVDSRDRVIVLDPVKLMVRIFVKKK